MSTRLNSFVVQRNGRASTAEELGPLAFAGYAHFTAMQVRGGQVRGLDLHLERLRFASVELFGQALPDDRMRSYLRAALQAGPGDLSLMATVYSPAGEFTVAGADTEPEVLVRTGPAASGPEGPLRLATVEYERFLPAVKHVGELAKTYFLRQAVRQGFDDAAFVDRRGRLSEGSIWNLAFWGGDAEVTLADLPTLAGAVVMNSWTPGVAVHQIGSVPLPEAPSFLELLHRAYQAEPLTSP